jgi:hypothetical protein
VADLILEGSNTLEERRFPTNVAAFEFEAYEVGGGAVEKIDGDDGWGQPESVGFMPRIMRQGEGFQNGS